MASHDSGRHLLETARKRFLQWGYSGTSTGALADDLGLTKAALYYHYADKESLFLAVVEDYLGELQRDLEVLAPRFACDSSPGEALVALAEVFLSRDGSSAQMEQLAFQESRHLSVEGQSRLSGLFHRSLVAPMDTLLNAACANGWIRSPVPDEPPTVWLFLGLVQAFLRPGHRSPRAAHRSAIAFVRLFQGALGSPTPT